MKVFTAPLSQHPAVCCGMFIHNKKRYVYDISLNGADRKADMLIVDKDWSSQYPTASSEVLTQNRNKSESYECFPAFEKAFIIRKGGV